MKVLLRMKATQLATLLSGKKNTPRRLTWSGFENLHAGYRSKTHSAVAIAQISSTQDVFILLASFFANGGLATPGVYANMVMFLLSHPAAKWFISKDDKGNIISMFSTVDYIGFSGIQERYDIFDVWFNSCTKKEYPAFAKAMETILVRTYNFDPKMMFARH